MQGIANEQVHPNNHSAAHGRAGKTSRGVRRGFNDNREQEDSEMINIQPITDVGQVVKGDLVLLEMKSGEVKSKKISNVLFSGCLNEEVIYNNKKNHYYITDCLLTGSSHVKNVSKVMQPRSSK